MAASLSLVSRAVPGLALCLLTAIGPGQAPSAGTLRFSGTGVVGTPLTLAFVGGAKGGSTGFLVLSPRTGSFTAGGVSTGCFAAAPGLLFEAVPLDAKSAFALVLGLPRDRQLVGRYFAGQVFRLDGAGILGSNCASFMVASDIARLATTETFDDASGHAPELAAGDWAGSVAGALRPGRVGGTGVLGRFDHTLGTPENGAFVFDTDAHAFPASAALLGAPVRVTDGVFEFLDFHVPAGVTVRFRGSNPARILVTGDARIDGVLDVSAADLVVPPGTATETAGQPGGAPGPGGGGGGAGGDAPSVTTGSPGGRPGDDLQVVSGSPHAAAAAGTGGAGSAATPDDPTKVTYAFFGTYSNQMAQGGGGGGFATGGQPSRVIAERAPQGGVGTAAAGGALLALLPARPGSPSRVQFLVGGSGGGGGGAHAYDAVRGRPVRFVPGSGGGGGGGALLLAVGGDLTISSGGRIHADGGSAASRTDKDGLLRAPGGGGSGGTVLFQIAGAFANHGEVTARGGAGGVTEDLRATPGTRVAGGKGAPGFIRLETLTQTPVAALGTMDPPAATSVLARLADVEDRSIAASGWYPVPPNATPAFLGYELYAVEGGAAVVYSDRRGLGSGPVRQGHTPVTLFTRFARLDPQGVPVPGTATAWYEGAALPGTASDGVQVLFYFDRTVLGPRADLRLECLRLTW